MWIHRRAQDCWNKNVFSSLLNWNRLLHDCLISVEREFHTWGPETANALWPDLRSRNLGTMRSPREAERRHCRPEDELTGRQSSVRYSGAAPTIQWRTRRAILNRMRFSIGNHWSSLRMAAETLSNLGTPKINLAVEFRTDWSRSRRKVSK